MPGRALRLNYVERDAGETAAAVGIWQAVVLFQTCFAVVIMSFIKTLVVFFLCLWTPCVFAVAFICIISV